MQHAVFFHLLYAFRLLVAGNRLLIIHNFSCTIGGQISFYLSTVLLPAENPQLPQHRHARLPTRHELAEKYDFIRGDVRPESSRNADLARPAAPTEHQTQSAGQNRTSEVALQRHL